MTRIMSAAFPMSSVTAVDGVSGEMATPAFIPRFWIFSMSGRGAAEEKIRIDSDSLVENKSRSQVGMLSVLVASRWKQYNEPPASAISSTH